MTNITTDEWLAELARIRIESEQRPAGYYTKADISTALYKAGKASTLNGAKSKAQRTIEELLFRNPELPRLRVRIVSPGGKATFATAYKLIDTAKQGK